MAAITSLATGNWATGASWTGGVVPVAGDTVTIQNTHIITIPISTTVTIGAAPASGNAVKAIDIATGGQLINNGTLNCRGDFRCSSSNTVRSYIQGPGAIFKFDFSATSSPSSQVYDFIQPAQFPGTQPSAQINGSSGSRATFTTIGGGRGRFAGTGANYFSLPEWYYCDFTHIGSASTPVITPSITGDGSSDPGTKCIIEDCTFDDCGAGLDTNGVNIDFRALFSFKRNKFTNSLQSYCLRTDSYGLRLGAASTRQIWNNTFDQRINILSPSDFSIKGNFITDAWSTTGGSGPWLEFKNNLVRITSTAFNDPTVNGLTQDNMFVFDAPAASNPHLLTVGVHSNTSIYTVQGNIFKFTGSASDGDCITFGTPAAAVHINILNNIVLPNESGESTGTLVSATGGPNITATIDHNTYFLGTGGGIAFQESDTGHVAMYDSIRSNLPWDTSARAYKAFDSGTNNSVTDMVSAVHLDYNGGYNFLTGSNGNGYNNIEFGSGTPGAHDISGNPNFADVTADLDTWDASLGGAGTIASAMARMRADTTSIISLINYIRDGFAPTNAIYHNTGHDGTTIGAVPFSGVSAATGFTFTGPGSGVVSVASSNFTVTPNGVYTGTITPAAVGGGSFSPTSLSWTSSSAAKTFTYTPTTTGSKTISITNDQSLTNPTSLTYTSNASGATAFTFTGPSGGVTGVPSTNFTVTPNGSFTGIVTPTAGGGGGVFSPSTLSWTNDNSAKTFVYTPTTSGAKTLSLTNNASVTNPADLTYITSDASATALAITGPSEGEVGFPSTNFTVIPNGSFIGTVTPVAVGGGSFTPSILTWNNTNTPQSFVYIPTTEGGKTISLSNSASLSNPAALAFTATSKQATALTFLGPNAGYINEASGDFVVIPDGLYSGTITPNDGTGGGTFTPTYLIWNNSKAQKMFKYTPVSEGDKTITIESSGSLSVPGTLSYKASRRQGTKNVCDPCGYYPFTPADECNTDCYSGQYGPSPCDPVYSVLRSNFTTPAVNTSVIVKVSDSTQFYVGQGVKIGPAFYQIVDILSGDSIEIQHNGIGATLGFAYVAVHPSQGCYQYPIQPAGIVPLEIAPVVKGRNADGTVKGSTITLTGSFNATSYGNLGPRRVKMDSTVTMTVTNTPNQITVDLPRQGRGDRPTSFSSSYYDGTKWIDLVSVLTSTEVVLVKPDNTVFPNATTVYLRVSGDYESSL